MNRTEVDILRYCTERIEELEKEISMEIIDPGPWADESIRHNKGQRLALVMLIERIQEEPMEQYWVMMSPYGHYTISASGHHGYEQHAFIQCFYSREVAEQFIVDMLM